MKISTNTRNKIVNEIASWQDIKLVLEKLIKDPILYEKEILHEEIKKIMEIFPNHICLFFRKDETIWEIE